MRRTTFLLYSIIVSFSVYTNVFAADGQKLFKANCGACHSIGKGKLVGPDLKGVHSRHDEAWLLKWIKSSQAMVKSGDKAAVQLFNDNANLIMQDFDLSDDEIKSILAFVYEKGVEIEAGLSQNAVADKSVTLQNNTQNANNSLLSMLGFSGYILLMLMSLFLVIIWVMSMLIKKLTFDLSNKK